MSIANANGGAMEKFRRPLVMWVMRLCVLSGLLTVLLGCSAETGRQITPEIVGLQSVSETGKGIVPGPGTIQVVDLSDGMMLEMVWIAPGSFVMGSRTTEDERDDDETQHSVTLTKGFWLGRFEVTQAQWKRVMGSNPSKFEERDSPVEQVSWKDSQEFIVKVNANLSAEGGGFRLPTEAEWEYACRAGGTGRFCFGDGDWELVEYAWYGDNAGRTTHAVGTRRPNAWGLYDMHGNVWEWCEDEYGPYASGPVSDPVGEVSTGSARVFRGGACDRDLRRCRSANRGRASWDARMCDVGFRLARTNPQ